MTEYKRRDMPEYRSQYRALVMKGDLPGFEAWLDARAEHLTPAERKEAIETFTHDAARALRFRWRSSK
jgi:hypothetical protein